MAAAARRRRRRADAAAPPRGGAAVRPRAPAAPKGTGPQIDGKLVNDSVGEIAASFNVTDEDRRRRQELRRKREAEAAAEEQEVDVIKELVAGEDPNFFGAPYIWIQVAHVVLFGYALIVCLIGEAGEENTLFALEGDQLTAFRTAVTVTLLINVVNAAVTFYEEQSSGEDRLYDAVGWGLKALLLGGVASWQRIGRIKRAEEKAQQEDEQRKQGKLGKVPAT
ncbi:unnamed protein product [Prorocentrum cordatum]|nr:unnamed protein product [Polarella glacialis]